MNFKSNSAYKKWLAYGHASGEFAKTPGNQPVSIKGQSHKVKHEMGGNMYKGGGSFNNKGFEALPIGIQKKIKDNSKKFAEGGQTSMGGPGDGLWKGKYSWPYGYQQGSLSYSPLATDTTIGSVGGMREFAPGQQITYTKPFAFPKTSWGPGSNIVSKNWFEVSANLPYKDVTNPAVGLNSYNNNPEFLKPLYTESKFPLEIAANVGLSGSNQNLFRGIPFGGTIGLGGGWNPQSGWFGGVEGGGTGYFSPNVRHKDYLRYGLREKGDFMFSPQMTAYLSGRQKAAPLEKPEHIAEYQALAAQQPSDAPNNNPASQFFAKELSIEDDARHVGFGVRPQVKLEYRPFRRNPLVLQALGGLDIDLLGSQTGQSELGTNQGGTFKFGDIEPTISPYGKISAIMPLQNIAKAVGKVLPDKSNMQYQGRIKNKGYEGSLTSPFGVRPIEPPVTAQTNSMGIPEQTLEQGYPIYHGPGHTRTGEPFPGKEDSASNAQTYWENFYNTYGRENTPTPLTSQYNTFPYEQRAQQKRTLNTINTGQRFKMGGNMRTYASGGMLDNQLTEFNNGGKHEENPIGGIPQGFSPDGRVNLVEEGETKLNSSDYVFSDTLKVTRDVALDYALPKDAVGKTYAEVSKKMNKPNSRRENDTIEEVAKQRDLDNLMQAQEDFKQRDLQKDIDMMNQKHPEFMAQMMGQGQPQGMDQQMMAQGVPPEQLMQMQGGMPPEMMQAPQSVQPMGMPQGMPMDPNQIPPEMLAQMPEAQMGQPVMAYGGHMYRCGGKMYNFGGNMYGQGGQILRGIGAAAYGAGEGLLDTLSGGLTDQLTDRGYNALTNIGDRTPEELAREASLRGFANTAGAVTGGVLSGGAVMGNAISEGSEGLGQGFTNIAGTGEKFDNVANTIANLGSMAGSFIGNPADAATNATTETADAMSKVPKFAQKIMDAAKNENLKQIPGVLDSVAGIVGQGIENNAAMNAMTEQEMMNQPRMVTGYNMAPTPMQMKYGGYKAQAPWHNFPQYTPNYPGNAGPMYMGLGTNLFNQGGYMNRNNTMYSPDLTYAAKMGGQLYNYGGGLNAPLMPTIQDDFVRYDEGGKIVQGKGEDPYQYKSENGKYYTAKKGTSAWSEISPLNKTAYNAIKALIDSAPATSTDMQDFKDLMMSNMEAEERGDIVAPTIEEAQANQVLAAAQKAMQDAETSQEYLAAAQQYQSALQSADESLANRNTDLSMKQGLLSGAAMAIPAAYNLGAGLFGKAEQLDPRKYMIPEDITPYEYNINPELANARQTYAQAQEAFRNASMGGGNYMANMQQLANQRNQTIGKLYTDKENLDAAQIQAAKAANKEIQTANLARQMEIEEFNRLSKAAKQGLLQTGITQLADIGKGAESKKLDLAYIKAVAPDFAENLSYSSLGQQFLEFLKKQKEANLNKTK